MNKHCIWLIALAVAGAPSGSLAAQSAADTLLARSGRFQLDNREVKTLIGHSRTRAYHVCMQAGPLAVPLKVMHDSTETIVQPGECQLIATTKIKLAAASKLDRGMILIGSRKNVSGENLKKYEVVVAGERVMPRWRHGQLVARNR